MFFPSPFDLCRGEIDADFALGIDQGEQFPLPATHLENAGLFTDHEVVPVRQKLPVITRKNTSFLFHGKVGGNILSMEFSEIV